MLLERAFALIDDMKGARIPTDAAVWNALVTAAGRAGQLQRAFNVLEDMLGSGTRPNDWTYASLIDACARAGDKALALRVSRWGGVGMAPPQQAQVAPSKLAKACIAASSWLACSSPVGCRLAAPPAPQVYRKAQREGCGSTLMVYSAAVFACIQVGWRCAALPLRCAALPLCCERHAPLGDLSAASTAGPCRCVQAPDKGALTCLRAVVLPHCLQASGGCDSDEAMNIYSDMQR